MGRVTGLMLVFAVAATLAGEPHTSCGTNAAVISRTRQLATWAERRAAERPRFASAAASRIDIADGIAILDADMTTAPFLRQFDLAGTTLTFTPQSAERYLVKRGALVAEPDRGTLLPLTGNPAYAAYELPFAFPLFDRSLRTVYVSRFNAIHGAAPVHSYLWQYDALEVLSLRSPLISPLLMTTTTQFYTPTVYAKSAADAVTFTWDSPAYEVRVTLFASGEVRFSYVRVEPLEASKQSSSVVLTSGTESWRSATTTLGETADPAGDLNSSTPASLAPFVDVVGARLVRVGNLDLLRAEVTTAAPQDWTALGPSAELRTTITFTAGSRSEAVTIATNEYGPIPDLRRPIDGMAGVNPTASVRQEGATLRLDVLEEILGFRPTTVACATYLVKDNHGYSGDAASFAAEPSPPAESTVTDFSALSAAGVTKHTIVESFVRPTVNLEGVWTKLRSAFGWSPSDVDAVAVYETFRTDLDFFAAAYAYPGNPGVAGIGPMSSPALPRFPTLLQMNIAPPPGTAGHVTTLLHEFGHRWLFYSSYREGSNDKTDLNPDSFHPAQWVDTRAAFNVETGNDCSVMGGAVFTATGGNAFAIAPRAAYGYSFLELYLMGLAGKNEVQPVTWLANTSPPLGTSYWPSPAIKSVTGTKHEVAVEQVVTSSGERVPTYPTAQNRFKVAFVLLRDPMYPELGSAVEGVASSRTMMIRDFRLATGSRGEIVPLDAAKAGRRRTVRH